MRLRRVRAPVVKGWPHETMKCYQQPRIHGLAAENKQTNKPNPKRKKVAQFNLLQRWEDVTVSLHICKKLPPVELGQDIMGLNYSKGG